MDNKNWIWWSIGAILATAVITIAMVGLITGQWPWQKNGYGEYHGINRKEPATSQTTGATGATEDSQQSTTQESVPVGTTLPEATEPGTIQPTSGTDTPTKPNGKDEVDFDELKPGNGGTTPTTPTEPEETQPEVTEPEATEPEVTEPSTPTQPDEDEGGGEKPRPGDIDVPIN